MGAIQQILLSYGAPPTSPATFSDDFNDSIVNAIWENAPGVMQPFQEISGTALANANLTGAVVKTGAGTTFSPNQTVSVIISAGSITSLGPAVRHQWTSGNDVADCYYIFVNGDSSTAGVWKLHSNGSFAQITPTLTIGALAAGNILTLKASATGSVTLEILVGGVSKGSVVDDGSFAGAAYDTGQPAFLMSNAQFINAFQADDS